MRAGQYIIVSFVLSAFGTLGYYIMMPAPEETPGFTGNGADKELDEIVNFMDEQWGGYETGPQDSKAEETLDNIYKKQDALEEVLTDAPPTKRKDSPRTTAQQPMAAKPPKPNPAPTATTEKTALEDERDASEVLEQRTVLRGKDYPYKLIVPAGWKVVNQDEERIVLSWHDDVFVFFETGPWHTFQQEWLDKSLEDIQLTYPHLEALDRNSLNIDGRPWNQIYLREMSEVLTNPREMMLLTYGDRRRGSYRIIITGSTTALDKHLEAVNQLLSTYRFPPDNFTPEDVSTVRVYIDGKRQYY